MNYTGLFLPSLFFSKEFRKLVETASYCHPNTSNFQKIAILFFAKFLKITDLLHLFLIVRQIYKNKSNFMTQYEINFVFVQP